MKLLAVFLLILSLVHTPAQGSDTEVQFIDQMIEHNHQSVALAELAQKKGEDLEFKRFMRKLKRRDNRELKKLQSWREGYYDEKRLTLDWKPPQNLDDLESMEGGRFDVQLLDHMLLQHARGIRLFSEVLNSTQRTFLREFARKNLDQIKKEIAQMNELKQKLVVENEV